MNMEPDAKHCGAKGSPASSPSSSSEKKRKRSFRYRSYRLVEKEIEAAETLADLAQLAMRWRGPTTASGSASAGAQRVATESFTADLDLSHSAPLLGGAQPQKSATKKSAGTKRIRKDDCPKHIEVEQDAVSPKTASNSLVGCSKSRRNLTEEEKEARRIRRVLANRESARQTIRRRQALSEALTKRAAQLTEENEKLKKEKEMVLKEYESLESTNKMLKEQVRLKEEASLKEQQAKSINTDVDKTPVEQESSAAVVTTSSAAAVTTFPGNGPWFLYNHFPAAQIFWPSIVQSSNPVQVHHTPFNSVAIPSTVSVSCPSEPNLFDNQNNPENDNQTQNPLYMVPCPWLFPLPEFQNGQPLPSIGLIDKRAELSLGKQCSSSSSLNTVANVDYLPIKLTTEAPPGWTEARPINDPGHPTTRFPLDGAEPKTGFHIIGNFHGPSFDSNAHASAINQELQFHSFPNPVISSTPSLEKNQAKFMLPGKNLEGAVAAAEARKRRREITKLRNIQIKQSQMQC